MFRFDHYNFNVLDLDKSVKFYEDALGLKLLSTIEPGDGSFRIVFLGDGKSDFRLELTWLRDRGEPYDLGEVEFHLAFRSDDYAAAYEKHARMGIICYENKEMGLYFISDPDGYWIEILPKSN